MRSVVQAKGQVTLPIEAREDLGVKPGDEVIWLKSDSGAWEVWTFDRLVDHLGPTLAGLADWSKRVKRGYNPKRA